MCRPCFRIIKSRYFDYLTCTNLSRTLHFVFRVCKKDHRLSYFYYLQEREREREREREGWKEGWMDEWMDGWKRETEKERQTQTIAARSD